MSHGVELENQTAPNSLAPCHGTFKFVLTGDRELRKLTEQRSWLSRGWVSVRHLALLSNRMSCQA